MRDDELFMMRFLIALFVSVCVAVPVAIYKANKLIKEGKSTKYLPIKVGTAICLPILSIPFLLGKEFTWPDKLFVIILMGSVGASYIIGINEAQKFLWKILGRSLKNEDTGLVAGGKEDKDKDKNKH